MALIAGCAAELPKSTLSPMDAQQYRLAGVEVEIAPGARINWVESESEYATSKGLVDPGSGDNLSPSDSVREKKREAYLAALTAPEAKAHHQRRIAASMTKAFQAVLGPNLNGAKPARIRVRVESLSIASAAQRVVLGGNHFAKADVILVDEKGRELTSRSGISAMGLAGNGVVGVLVDQALDDPMDRVSQSLATEFTTWLLPQV